MTTESFPTTTVPETTPLTKGARPAAINLALARLMGHHNIAHDAIERLCNRGLAVHIGLSKLDIPQIQQMAQDPRIVEYCPNDKRRFADPEKWVSKGRAFFTLRDIGSGAIAGYGWSGPEPCQKLPNHPITTAFRSLSPGSGADFTRVVAGATRAIYTNKGMGLETWASNQRAVHTYLKVGTLLVATESYDNNGRRIIRPTLDTQNAALVNESGQPAVQDTRLYMRFPN